MEQKNNVNKHCLNGLSKRLICLEFMTTKTNKLKWLLSLVLIFGGFAVYEIFGFLAADFAEKKYSWVFKIIAEFGLFSSVMVSVGYFHHWLIATEEHKEYEKIFHDSLIKYVDSVLLGSIDRGFSGITNKELDFSEIMHGLKHGDYVYWLVTFDPRYKHQCREIENAVKDGVHIRLIIIKEGCEAGKLRAREITGFDSEEYSEYARLFKTTLKDVASHLDESVDGSLGVFISEGLPSVPLFIITRKKTKTVEVYSSFYLAEPVGRMPYLKWQSELKNSDTPSFESDHWNVPDLFTSYFQKRWYIEKAKIVDIDQNLNEQHSGFIYAPVSASVKCSELVD